MTRTLFPPPFLQLSGGGAGRGLCRCGLMIWRTWPAAIPSGAAPAAALQDQAGDQQSAVCLAPVAVAEQQKIFSKYNLDVEFVRQLHRCAAGGDRHR